MNERSCLVQQPLSNRRQRVLELAAIVAVIWEMDQGVGITQNRLDPLPQFVNVNLSVAVANGPDGRGSAQCLAFILDMLHFPKNNK